MRTNEETIERGLAAASLLLDPTFKSVISGLCYEQFCVFQETKPEEKQERENSYNLYQGLKAIEAELNARVLAKEQAVAALDAALEDQDDDDLDGPIIIQGDNDQ